ncbi:MAG: HAD family phosphatase [Anaerolineales bacterium]|nr:HAD family phosphatase [Anaerolineales bacterium]
MIEAVIFDLDGTLVQTEKLKAISYARAVADLCPHDVEEEQVFEAFRAVVGLPRREVAQALVEKFNLSARASDRMKEFGVSAPWQAFVQVRLQHYETMLQDSDLILSHEWPHNLAVLEEARNASCKTALATMSRCHHAARVLEILKLQDAFDFIATRDDVEKGKPDPEIYHLVANELGIANERCIVLEDSPSGVRAAVAAGMWCIAVTTPFTKEGVHELGLLEERWIVDEPSRAPAVVREMIVERQKER